MFFTELMGRVHQLEKRLNVEKQTSLRVRFFDLDLLLSKNKSGCYCNESPAMQVLTQMLFNFPRYWVANTVQPISQSVG